MIKEKVIYWGLVPIEHYQLIIELSPPENVNHYEDFEPYFNTEVGYSIEFLQAKRFENMQKIANLEV